MERLVMSSGVPATVLHPTLIYGADGFSNIERIIGIARKFPVIPLPRGGMSLIQPIHCDDVSAALMRCLDNASGNQSKHRHCGPVTNDIQDIRAKNPDRDEFIDKCHIHALFPHQNSGRDNPLPAGSTFDKIR